MRSLLVVGSVVIVAACSLLNREGPNVTCADLQNGATNACRNGIIATCSNGNVTYNVCDEKSACDQSWQKAGAFQCSQSGGANASSSSGSSGSSGTSSSGTSGTASSSGTSGNVDGGGPCTVESTCVIADTGGSTNAIALDANNVFMCDTDTIRYVPKLGGVAQTVVSGLKSCSLLLVDDANVFAATSENGQGSVVRVAKTGGALSPLIPTTENIGEYPLVAIDDTNIYWAGSVGSSPKALKVTPKLGGSVTTLSKSSDFLGTRLVVRSGFTYWPSSTTTMARLATNVSGPTAPDSIALGHAPSDFAVDNDAIFFTVSATQGGVWTVLLATGAVAKITDTTSDARRIAVNSTTTYWTQNGSIMKVVKGGSTPSTVANEGTQILAADDTFVFWTSGGKIMRAPK